MNIDLTQLITKERKEKEALEAARKRINDWRNEQEQGSIIFQYAGRNWDGGLAVRQRIMPVLALAELPEGFFWTDAEDNDIPITFEELRALAAAHESAIVTQGWEIHARQRGLKLAIEQGSLEDLLTFKPDWPADE